ncbi:MAG: hypothetical protein ACK47M_20640 [Caldilinea sp.]
MHSLQKVQSAYPAPYVQAADSRKVAEDASTAVLVKANALSSTIPATVRQLAIEIWRQHPHWEGMAGHSPIVACNYIEFTAPEYPNLRLQLLPGRRVHITNRVYWDESLVSSFDVPAYTERRHKPFFRRVVRSREGESITAIIDQWLALHGASFDALVAAEAAATEAKARRKQQERQQLWAQLLAPLPFEPKANIQTADRYSTPQIELTVGEVAVSATPNGTALTITLTPEQKAQLPEIIAALNQMVSDLARTPLEKGNN